MLGQWRSHAEYQRFVSRELSRIAAIAPFAVAQYEAQISKLYLLNLDLMKPIVAPLYSITGRPSQNQPQIFRSLVLMNALRFSLDQWVSHKLPKDPVLQAICGFDGPLPGIASYYDFMRRIINLNEKPRLKSKKPKPRKKYGKNRKMPPKHPDVVRRLAEHILSGRRFSRRPEKVLQQIFALVAVKSSAALGLIPKKLSISGDGTCIETGASHFGRKTCECKSFKCDCPRRFSDPNATWGWDSHNERYFYGYTGYFISTYNRTQKLDLPLYLRLVDAKRHDSVSAVVALAEFRDLYPEFTIQNFISDSASDNYATYALLDKWGINAIIALNHTNKGNLKYPTPLAIDDNGIPTCPGGNKMVLWGFCGKDRCRIKYRCPKKCGKPCENCENCSPSPYGRVVYTKPDWDLRLFTKVPRGSEGWRSLMKERTAAERVNNRILNHYGVENARTRGKGRISFLVTLAAINVHLDAQLAKLKQQGLFRFEDVVGADKVA
jgi:hypothetical protein